MNTNSRKSSYQAIGSPDYEGSVVVDRAFFLRWKRGNSLSNRDRQVLSKAKSEGRWNGPRCYTTRRCIAESAWACLDLRRAQRISQSALWAGGHVGTNATG